MFFNIKYDQYREGEDAKERFGDWWESISTTLNYAEEVKEKGYWDVALFPGQVPPKHLDDVYVVWVEYGTGDSFGSSTGNTEFLYVFTDEKKAFELEKLISADYKKKPDFDFKGKNQVFLDGVTISTSTWKGFFESLEAVHVDRIPVKKLLEKKDE